MNSTEGNFTHSSNPTPTPSSTSARYLTERLSYNQDAMAHQKNDDELAQEDLLAFESRLKELATGDTPTTFPWIPVFGTIFVCTAISTCHWLPNVRDSQSIVLRSLSSRGAFTLSLAALVLAILFGAKHIGKEQSGEDVQLSGEILALFRLECDKGGNVVQVPPTNPQQTTDT